MTISPLISFTLFFLVFFLRMIGKRSINHIF